MDAVTYMDTSMVVWRDRGNIERWLVDRDREMETKQQVEREKTKTKRQVQREGRKTK